MRRRSVTESGMARAVMPRGAITVRVQPATGAAREIQTLVRIDTPEELTAFRHGGILPYVLRQLVQN